MILVTDNYRILAHAVYTARDKRKAILNSLRPISKPARKTGKRIQAGLVIIPSKPAPAPLITDASKACHDILSAWQGNALADLPARMARRGY